MKGGVIQRFGRLFGRGCLGRGDVAENQLGQLIRLAIPPDLQDIIYTLVDLGSGFVREQLVDDPLVQPQLAAIRSDLEHIVHGWVNRSAVYCGCSLRKGFYHLLLVFGRLGYSHTAAYASEHGEREQYRASNRANLQCKEAIEAAVREHFDGMYLNQDAAKGVIQTYGLDRVMLVLANTVQLQDWDGRYSHRNKEWAKTIPNYNSDTVRRGYALNSHPAVLDGFIDLVREEQQRSHTKGEKAQQPRTSVRDKLKQEPPAHKPVTQKKREQER